MKNILNIVKNSYFLFVSGLLLGAVVILGVRFFSYKPDKVHYHANFAVYINGQRDQFKGPLYYEETQMCAQGSVITPNMRAHMHNNVNDVVHVEDHAVTWGQFFDNLGVYLGDDFIKAGGVMHQSDATNSLSIILNGQDLSGISSITNRVIADRDKLLVSFGSDSPAQLQKEYKAIPSTAAKEDSEKDAGGCGGSAGPTLHDRLTHLF